MATIQAADRVIAITADQLQWGFDSPNPCAKIGSGVYSHRAYVDPFPCYAHEVEVAAAALTHVESVIDIAHKPTVYILDREPTGRTNGYATTESIYDDDERPDAAPRWNGIIVLGGKRIPLHPAMTRYLVAHEYGHHVEFELLHRRGLAAHHDEIREEYAELRGCAPVHYGGGTWHRSPGELLANDFRVLIAGVEPEFWPHPGFSRPDEDDAVRAWWAEQL